MFWENFLHGNEWYWRLLRTIVQAILGIIVASIDEIVAGFEIDPNLKPIIVAAVMSLLSPIMAKLGDGVYAARIASEYDAEVMG